MALFPLCFGLVWFGLVLICFESPFLSQGESNECFFSLVYTDLYVSIFVFLFCFLWSVFSVFPVSLFFCFGVDVEGLCFCFLCQSFASQRIRSCGE
jgi:hypothetical protein